MCQFHNIYYISYNQHPLKCICAKFGDSTFFSRFFYHLIPRKSRFMTFLPKLPQKCSPLGGVSQTLLIVITINNSLSVHV